MVKLVLDCFGGDNSPGANVQGAVSALGKQKDLQLVLTGDEEKIKSELSKLSYDKDRLEIVNAPEVIGCDEKPTDAIRLKKESSMMKAVYLCRKDDSIDGMISVGSTGALVAAATVSRKIARGYKTGILPDTPHNERRNCRHKRQRRKCGVQLRGAFAICGNGQHLS